ncbi:hypothetical protein [uncultured Parolsenella sp.]|uniref:hypothetical protein n=1 Tax=uncultured Parolsenella sp. TaxID=2083008 RepID=UPI0025FED292|nr:hypothetical protein [uncultured Parolsenella sp.]
MHDDYDDGFDLDDYLHKSKSERKFSYGGIMMTPSELERVMREEDRERERELEERRRRNAPKFFVSINFTHELKSA